MPRELTARTIRLYCRTIFRCRRTTAPRAICPACGLPDIALPATDGRAVNLSRLARPHRRLRLSAHRRARRARCRPAGTTIPGARGCTPQSCGFRDHFAELKGLGVAHVYGLSTQDTAYQREAAERLHLPFPILSDAELQFTRAIELPTSRSPA